MFANLYNFVTNFAGTALQDTVGAALGLTGSIVSELASSALWVLKTPFFYLLEQIIQLLPEGGAFPQVVHDSASYLGNSLSLVSFVLPVYDLLLIASIVFSIQITVWIFAKIQGVLGVNNQT